MLSEMMIDRTEFPEVVTAFKRLNIMQGGRNTTIHTIHVEIALGSIYRLFNLKTVIKNPFNFYACAGEICKYCSHLLQSFSCIRLVLHCSSCLHAIA